LPAGDRRTYVAWSECKPEDFFDDYWANLYAWYENGGNRHVTAYLETLDISGFDPKAPPAKTPVFWEIVAVSEPPEDAELKDGIDRLGAEKHRDETEPGTEDQRRPDVLTPLELVGAKGNEMLAYLLEHKHRKSIPHRLNRCGYKIYRNIKAKDGYWKIKGARQPIYVRAELSAGDARAVVAGFLGVNPSSLP
jgi:hypothetical protein